MNLPTNFVIVILVQFCIFHKQKNPIFFSFSPPEFTASVTTENTLFYRSCWQKWMNLCLWHSVALSFSQFQVMLENFRSGGFSRQRFSFLLFKTASVFFLALTSCITLVYADWARSAPVPSVKGLKALAQLSPATSLCLFSIVFCSVNICRFLPGASFNMKTLTKPILYWISLETGDSHHKPNLEVFFKVIY